MGLRRVGKSLGGSSFEIVWQDPNKFVQSDTVKEESLCSVETRESISRLLSQANDITRTTNIIPKHYLIAGGSIWYMNMEMFV